MTTRSKLTAKIEPFDSFWEGPEDVEKGYGTFYKFYKHNYLKHLPANREANILAVSCGPGYLVNMLANEGYTNVLGIDSDPSKVRQAQDKGLNCAVEEAFPFLEQNVDAYDAVFFESEINHLSKDEILELLVLVQNSLRRGGTLIIHSMNGANPFTGSEGLALNIDHYNTFTEQSLRQILKYSGYQDIKVIPLKLFVFFKNPLNYVGIVLDSAITLALRAIFIFYGKSNKIFTKKVAAIAHKA